MSVLVETLLCAPAADGPGRDKGQNVRAKQVE